MRFRPYPKMSSAPASSGGGAWVALEKIHGAHFVIGVERNEMRFGKRKAWLSDADPFFGWQLLRAELTERARSVARTLSAPSLYLYGELFGGHYPHPDVAEIPGLAPVQTGVWYAPDLRWAVFDVLAARGDDDDGELLAHSDVEALAASEGLLVPPVVARGGRADLAFVPTRGPTRVPALLGLPAIDGNIAEGIVAKPDARATPSRRGIYKRKVEEFGEGRFDESAAWNPAQRLTLDELLPWAERLVTPARVASARSKVGPGDERQLIDELVLDVRVDLEEAFPMACSALTPEDEARLEQHLARRARDQLAQDQLGSG